MKNKILLFLFIIICTMSSCSNQKEVKKCEESVKDYFQSLKTRDPKKKLFTDSIKFEVKSDSFKIKSVLISNDTSSIVYVSNFVDSKPMDVKFYLKKTGENWVIRVESLKPGGSKDFTFYTPYVGEAYRARYELIFDEEKIYKYVIESNDYKGNEWELIHPQKGKKITPDVKMM